MTCQEELYFNGFIRGAFDQNKNLFRCVDVVKEIVKKNIKENFTLEKKYESSLDLRPNVFSYDNSFIDILFDNDIHNMVCESAGVELFLAHIQLRIAYPSSKRTYINWHRDTHSYNNDKTTGNVPPIFKLIWYPNLGHKSTPQLKLVKSSNNFIFGSKLFDLIYARLVSSTTIFSNNAGFLFFNTSMLHKAVSPLSKEGSVRIIYSFVRKEQLSNYDESVSLLYAKRIANL